jgi:hypothetical protein
LIGVQAIKVLLPPLRSGELFCASHVQAGPILPHAGSLL